MNHSLINGCRNTFLKVRFLTITPFQKSVYDAIDGRITFDEIKQKLIRFKSGNFEEKINRNLNDLIDKDLVKKDGDYFQKC